MGKKLDALLGRTFKTSKFKVLINLAISRLAVLKNQRQIRCSNAWSEVAQLLEMGQQERALLRVENVIKDQNMFDAFVMIERYCDLLIERVALIESLRECPHELKEAISGLIFAASRCGDFPELEQVREIFTSRFGKEFSAAAVELHNNCGVNPKMIQKMSTRQPSLESKLKVMKEIAFEKGIMLDIEEPCSGLTKEDRDMNQKTQNQAEANKSNVVGNTDNSNKDRFEDDTHYIIERERSLLLSETMKGRKKYADVATAAQAAFESAAQAAAAARAALELSRSEIHDKGSDDQSRSRSRKIKSEDDQDDELLSPGSRSGETPSGTAAVTEKTEGSNGGSNIEKIHPPQNSNSEENVKVLVEQGNNRLQEDPKSKQKAKMERSTSVSSLDLNADASEEANMLNELGKNKDLEKAIHFDETDEETEKEGARIQFKSGELHLDGEPILLKEVDKSPTTKNELPSNSGADFGFKKYMLHAVIDDEVSVKNEGVKLQHPNAKQNLIKAQAYSANIQHEELGNMGSRLGNDCNKAGHANEKTQRENLNSAEKIQVQKKPVSVRTRRVFKW